MSEETGAGITGASQGAMAGYQVGGVYGAIAGGIIGGISGLFAGGKARRSRILYNKAQKLQRKISYLDAGIQRRDLVRSARANRADSVAASYSTSGGYQSSPTLGAIGSIGSQTSFNLNYFDQRIATLVEAQRMYDKSGKLARQSAEAMALLSMATSAVGNMGSMGSVTPSQGNSSPLTSSQYGQSVSVTANRSIPVQTNYGFGS